MGHNYHSVSIDATIMVSKNFHITGEYVGIIVVMGFRATLNFENLRWLCKLHLVLLILSCLSKFYNKKNFRCAVLKI